LNKSKLRNISHGKTFTGKKFETTDYTDYTDKKSEISVDSKPRRRGGKEITIQGD